MTGWAAEGALLHDTDHRLMRGDLARRYRGVVVIDWFSHHTLQALAEEATQAYTSANCQDTERDDLADHRGGTPARRVWSAGGGPVQDAIYHDPELHCRLSALCGATMVPTGARGSFSYYFSGAFLALHRDIPTCDLSLITMLSDTTPPRIGAGCLSVYRDRNHEVLSSIRATPRWGAERVEIDIGYTALILGGLIAHEVLPVAAGHQRVISVLCFQALSDP